VVQILDITDQLQAEQEKKQLEAKLIHAQKMEAIGTLAGGIAHDFNNLLMAIQGRISLMQLDMGSEHRHYDHVTAITRAVKSAANLTKQLLGYARGGKYAVQVTNPNDLIEKSSQMFSRTRKEIQIYRRCQEDIRTVEVDRGQIEQVLLNLYVNAWQAMPDGGGLYIETENVELDEKYCRPFDMAPGNYVKISVTDTGTGMDKSIVGRIFEPFFTTKEMGKGTGLGLASAYGIIKNHNGIIRVYSEKGHGTTFNIYLPASSHEVPRESRTDLELVKGHETILLVDDEEDIIEVGELILKSLGYKVLLAGSGKEAVDISKRSGGKVDLVILDMVMPEMGGRETFDLLKEIDPEIKVLLSSGYSLTRQAEEMLACGCKDFIQKPFDMNRLSQKIRRIIDN
jgi:nitrogen-specific signal transduction histidine kinase/CheY-like chemotaxis protein